MPQRSGQYEIPGRDSRKYILPNWRCADCGQDIYQPRQPVHCPKCGHIIFEKVEAPHERDWLQRVIGGTHLLQRQAQAIRLTVTDHKHRRRRSILRAMTRIEAIADRATLALTEALNPDEIEGCEVFPKTDLRE